MKKLIIVGLMLLSSSLFALTEGWMAFGFEWGNSFEKDSAYLSSLGTNWSVYSFDDKKNIGTFMRSSFLFPFNADDFAAQIGLMTGVAFRLPMSERLNIHAGLAPQIMLMTGGSTDEGDNPFSHSSISLDLGIGADAGIKFDITDIIFINAGVEFSYSFANYSSKTSARLDGSEQKRIESWAKDYMQFGVRPYLTLGFNWYQAVTHGKPPVVK
jgi:hypothetical protein